MKPTLIVVIAAFIATQTHALVLETNQSMTAVQLSQMLNDPEHLLHMVDDAQNSLDQMISTAASTAEEESAPAETPQTLESRSHKYTKIYNRWIKKLNGNLGDRITTYNRHLDNMTDEGIKNAVMSFPMSNETRSRIGASPRQALKDSFASTAPQLAQYTAASIAQKGGIIPYLWHLKGELKQAKVNFSQKLIPKKADRSIASDQNLPVILLVVAIIAGLLIGGALLIAAGTVLFGSILVGVGVAYGIIVLSVAAFG